MGSDRDYLLVLHALADIPFGVGKKLLIEFLQGKRIHESIVKNRLYDKEYFGSMAYSKEELSELIDSLLLNNLIRTTALSGNRFWKVLELSAKGHKELEDPTLYKKKLAFNLRETRTEITESDRAKFAAFGTLLEKFNEAQKKSIISDTKSILCLAGAGSGKTTVLTKRIEFLVRYRSVDPRRVLAITFTRKARQEMRTRLDKIGGLDLVTVETFNSFCEKILRQHNNLLYEKPVRVISYRDKILLMNRAINHLGLDMGRAIAVYFTEAQRNYKTNEQLAHVLMNDCFFLRDYFKFKNQTLSESSFDIVDKEHEKSAKMVSGICTFIEQHMEKNGLRDFADQLLDTIRLFEEHKELIPEYEHVLIDEYQDVNSTQIKLADILAPPNLFCVGDPRQSIYGWRGSDIRYILNFEDKYPECEIITLTKNYRSTKCIVELINKAITNMGLADLESAQGGNKDIKLLKFGSEESEAEFVIQCILKTDCPREEIFVLARTNRQLKELSQNMKMRGISHVVRSDETRKSVVAKEGDVTLATIHAIKGLEAKTVFVIGCTGNNFPCRGSEHPVVDMVTIDEYDKEEEERRLFYVAMSRAKQSLYLTYSGKKTTTFLTPDMQEMIDGSIREAVEVSSPTKYVSGSNDVVTRLKSWRMATSQELGVPAFMVLHDRTLLEIAQKLPLTSQDLEGIHGMGPTKIMKYGEDILTLVIGV